MNFNDWNEFLMILIDLKWFEKKRMNSHRWGFRSSCTRRFRIDRKTLPVASAFFRIRRPVRGFMNIRSQLVKPMTSFVSFFSRFLFVRSTRLIPIIIESRPSRNSSKKKHIELVDFIRQEMHDGMNELNVNSLILLNFKFLCSGTGQKHFVDAVAILRQEALTGRLFCFGIYSLNLLIFFLQFYMELKIK